MEMEINGAKAAPCPQCGGAAGEDAAREATIKAEVDRVSKLPRSSVYATHRLKILGKMLDLLKIPRKDRLSTEMDDLERLLAELSF